jgi:alpha/beta superfamily hydrolase
MCHGIDSHKQEYLDMHAVLAQRLAERGVASLRFDFRGHGESSGTNLDFDVSGQIIDLDAAVRWLGANGHDNSRKVFLGVSFGAAPGLFWSLTRAPFARVCLFAPVLSYKDTFLEPTTEWGRAAFNPRGFRHAAEHGYLVLDESFRVSIKLIEEMRLLDPRRGLAAFGPGSVLAIHGTADSLVPCSTTQELTATHPNVEVRIIPGMDHGLFVVGDDDGLTSRSHDLQARLYQVITDHLSVW